METEMSTEAEIDKWCFQNASQHAKYEAGKGFLGIRYECFIGISSSESYMLHLERWILNEVSGPRCRFRASRVRRFPSSSRSVVWIWNDADDRPPSAMMSKRSWNSWAGSARSTSRQKLFSEIGRGEWVHTMRKEIQNRSNTKRFVRFWRSNFAVVYVDARYQQVGMS